MSTQSVHFARYRAGPKASEFEEVVNNKKLFEKVIKTAQEERAAPIVSGPRKDASQRFCVDYRKMNAVSKRDI